MGRKATGDGRKREEILEAAGELIFTRGFDATSVRSIMKKAGGEVGLFYYYFESKDEVFDRVLDRFFSHYVEDFTRIVEHGRRNPCRIMYEFFTYMEQETDIFRQRYAEHMHRTVRWAIREHTLEIIEPFIRQVVEIQSAYYGTAPALDPEVATVYLAYGVGSSILHEEREFYLRHQQEIQKGTSLIMNMPAEEQQLRIPLRAGEKQEAELEHLLRTEFGGNLREYVENILEILPERIRQEEVWYYSYNGEAVAMALFSKEKERVELLLVKKCFRGRGLAHRLMETVAAEFPVGSRLSACVPVKFQMTSVPGNREQAESPMGSTQNNCESPEEDTVKNGRHFLEHLEFTVEETIEMYGGKWLIMGRQVPKRL